MAAMTLRDLAPAGITLVVAGIVFGIGGDILTTMRDNQGGPTTTAYGITNSTLGGIAELASWMPTIGLVIAAAIVIGIVIAAFAFGRE